MQKELVLQFAKRKNFLSLGSISNHALTNIQRLSQCLPSPESSGFLSYCSLPGSSEEVVTIAPFSWIPSSPYLMLPSWELQGGDQSPLLPTGVGPDWRLALGPYLILWPLLVGWSIPPMSPVGTRLSRELEHQCDREPGIPLGGMPPHLSRSSFAPDCWATFLAAQGAGVVGILLGPPEMLQKPVIDNPTPHSESWKTQVYYASGPRGVNTPSSEPLTKGLQSFYKVGPLGWFKLRFFFFFFFCEREQQSRWEGGCLIFTWTGMIKQVCKSWAVAKSRAWVSEISSSS